MTDRAGAVDRPLRIIVDALFLDPPMGGVETYLRELCRHLLSMPNRTVPELVVYLNPAGYAGLAADDWASEARLISCPRIGRSGVRALSELSVLGAMADWHSADVVHSVAMTGPLVSRAARVVTIPDTVWITNPENTATHRLWRTVVPWVARRADRVLAISHAAAEELAEHLHVAPDRMDVVPLGYRPPDGVEPTPETELRAGLGLSPQAPIVLNVGQKKPHRNLERLISAMVDVRAEVPGAVLVLPGPPNDEAERSLLAHAAAYGLGPDAVVIPGYLARTDIEGLYAAAAAFVLPSLVEGFGLPVLEAMARSTPVACSDRSAPGEVAGDAALLFDPTDTAAIAAATVRLLQDDVLRRRLSEAGPVRVAGYTWQRCAEGTMDSYVRAMRDRAA